MSGAALASGSAPPSPAAGAERAGGRVRELVGWPALGAILLAGGLLRWPHLQTLPKLTDELRDAIFSLPIARGESFPLANFSAYDGALFNYLQAGLFLIVGPELAAPRWLMFWLGLLALALACGYARRRYGWTAGLLAAAMLATSPVHILVNSRIAWGNCLTPLFTTAGVWLLDRATVRPGPGGWRRQPGWNLLPAGLAFGLALQTHPTVAAVLPGAALGLLLVRPGLARTGWPLLGLVGFLIGYGNMIAFNLSSNFESIAFARQTRAEYTGQQSDLGHGYLDNLATLLSGLLRLLGGAVEDRATPGAFFGDPLLLLTAALAIAGLIWAARRGDRLPLAVVLSGLALLPAVNDRYEPVLDGRYLGPLQPLICATTAGLLVRAWGGRRTIGRAVGLVGGALVVLAPLLGLQRYYEQNAAAGLRSARLWDSVELAERNLPPAGEAIFDRDLERTVLGAGSTELLVFEYAFTLHDLPYRVVRVTPGGLAQLVSPDGSAQTRLVVMERAKRKLLDARLRVRQLDPETIERNVQAYVHGVYLVGVDPRAP